ncbi:hypothetical protein BH10PLA2_BH10PLA2_10250 [soil metagenome]
MSLPVCSHRQQTLRGVCFFLAAVGWALLPLSGCSPKPRAPALEAGPVYQSKQEGIRFRVPDSWVQTARGEFPPGKLEKERLLVAYRATDRIAAFELNVLDYVEGFNLAAYLAEGSYGSKNWKPSAAPEAVKIGELDGKRYVLTGRIDKEMMTLEVISVHRGDRVYLFQGIFSTADKTAREQLREAVQSVIMRKT